MTPYACHNRAPYIDTLEKRDHHGTLIAAWPFVMARDCRYTLSELGKVDSRCEGCKWKVNKGT